MVNSVFLYSYDAKVNYSEAHCNSGHVELLFTCNSQYINLPLSHPQLDMSSAQTTHILTQPSL